ncbi:signal transduction histidine kinase [Actinoplanes tereljensis]|uniref:Sensor-like histidine kinase SenX3 n=1 Tax=Paractinoplanes tereljensis TaxID=571912 RepID=A0A919TRL4_9ACTN|nr:HAMP domain-containing sensor histidine kinase [Actinoplanes tereljensis]GIF18202.1 hypothetical protein Ate02nite_09320 [Actinoplanes tereljensis]
MHAVLVRHDEPSALAELRDLMAMASHDLKSPLAAALSNLEMLREDHADHIGDDGERCLAATERALARVNGLVEDLLAYAMADQKDINPHAVRLADVIADHDVTVRGPLPTVLADPKLLRHVLDNLIGNAIKYTPGGVRPQVEVHAQPYACGLVRIEVADRGIGIPEADRPRVFEAFHRSANSSAYRGTGLGLAICRRIVERHGGQIGVEENPGGGSLFWFTLPAAS